MHVTSEQRERAVTDAHLLCVCMYADWGGEVAGKGGGGGVGVNNGVMKRSE